jgi:methylated-DNA-[protein]-cysteine S-methyltransferase
MNDHLTHYCLFDTAIGSCGVAWNHHHHGVTRLQLPEADARATERRLGARATRAAQAMPEEIHQLVADVQTYMTGRRVDFDSVAIDMSGVEPFQLKVYEAARAIPWGQTVSYGELAQRTGFPGGARAVGRALSRNPVPIIIPCHRVLAKGHRVGGFSAHGGVFTKERLLALEGVRVEAGTPLLPGFV